MAGKKDYESEAEKLLGPIAEEIGVRIYDVEYVKEGSDYYLRAYIDKDGGVTIDDCEAVSRAFEAQLDESGLIDEQYMLEVSSPGLGRTLSKDRHLTQSLGEEVEISFYKPQVIGGTEEAPVKGKQTVGNLKAFDKETITVEDPDTGKDTVWNRSDISVIKLTFDL